MTEPMPDDAKRAKRVALIASVSVFLVGVTAILVWALIAKPGASSTAEQPEFEPAEPTAEATLPVVPSTPASGSSSTTTGSATASSPSGPGVTTPAGFTRAPKLAFRLGGSVYVAAEDGSGAVAVARVPQGPYALSPDARTLAVVESGSLVLYDVATGRRAPVGPAELSAPVWHPDSSAVLYVRLSSSAGGTPEVWRVSAGGTGAKRLEAGMEGAVSTDGRTTVIRPLDAGYSSPADASRLLVSVDGGFEPISLPGQPTAIAVGKDRVYVALVDAKGEPSIVSAAFDGTGIKKVLGAPPGGLGAVWGKLCLSSDGSRLAVAALGDDGYSRVRVVPAAGGTSTDLTPRRDAEIHGWSAKGDVLFLREGNSYQGETTALISVRPDGTKRTTVVTGAQ